MYPVDLTKRRFRVRMLIFGVWTLTTWFLKYLNVFVEILNFSKVLV